MENTILSIDCGTQSIRALLFNLEGDLIARSQKPYNPYFSEHPGYAEQDPEIYWNGLMETCLDLKQKEPTAFANIVGVGVTTQRATMINVDAAGKPLRPAIVWLDQRKAKQVYKPGFIMKQAYNLVGMTEPLNIIQAEAKGNWIQQNEPEVWAGTHKYLQTSGFLNFRLTGEFKDSIASQIGHIPFDYRKMDWAGKYALTSQIFPIEREKLPETLPPGAPLGRITEEASRLTGIKAGVPVIACGSDKGCENLGMGVTSTDMVSLSFGTTATVQTTSQKYFEPLKFMPPYPALIPDSYNAEVEIFRGYWMVSWFKNEFAHREAEEARQAGRPTEEILNQLLTETEPGAMGLTVQPYWSPGFKMPNAKGAMIGFGDVHKKAHVYRAVIEGLGYGLLDGLKQVEQASGTRVTRAAVSGGASQSDEICQISADIFNLPMLRGRTYETSGLGAAIVTAVGLNLHPNFPEAIKKMVHYEKTFQPNPKNVEIYDKLYNRVYRKMYSSLKHIYKEIRDITGYPDKEPIF